MFLIILLQTSLQDIDQARSISPGTLLIPEKIFDLNPTNVYGWLVWGLLGFVGYLKIESSLKSWTIRKKDAYIKELHQKLMDAERNSLTEEEAKLYKRIIGKSELQEN